MWSSVFIKRLILDRCILLKSGQIKSENERVTKQTSVFQTSASHISNLKAASLPGERKALFRSDGVLQSAPRFLSPTQPAKRQPATNTVRGGKITANEFRRVMGFSWCQQQSEVRKITIVQGNKAII